MKRRMFFPLIVSFFTIGIAMGQDDSTAEVYTITVETPGTFTADMMPYDVTKLKIVGALNLPDDCVELNKLLCDSYLELLDLEDASFLPYEGSVEIDNEGGWYTYVMTCPEENSFPVGLFNTTDFHGKLIMPSNIKTIQPYTFYEGALSDAEVIFSEGLETLGTDAFCFSRLSKIHLPQSLRHIGSGCFYSTNWLEELYIPDNVEVVEDSLVSNSGVKHLHLPNNLERIEWWSLDCCVETLTIPAGVKFVGLDALPINLKEIHCLATVPPECGHETSPFAIMPSVSENTFDNYLAESATLYVPRGTVEAYRNADDWKDFIDIREEIDGYEEDLSWYDYGATTVRNVNAGKTGTDFNVYTMQGVCVRKSVKPGDNWTEGLGKGVYIVGNEKRVVR